MIGRGSLGTGKSFLFVRPHVNSSDNSSLEGHRPDLADLQRDIYELLAFFLSSQRIAELEQSLLYGAEDPLHQFEKLERDLITKRLIAVAITIRILDDSYTKVFDSITDYCGTITQDLNNPLDNRGLGLRAACNKIIHARKVTFDVVTDSSGRTFLHPYLYLNGTENGKPWIVNLDVVKFCRESTAVLDCVR